MNRFLSSLPTWRQLRWTVYLVYISLALCLLISLAVDGMQSMHAQMPAVASYALPLWLGLTAVALLIILISEWHQIRSAPEESPEG